MTLRCFIAMAFDREDADSLYGSVIVPTLRKSRVTPVRIDRLEHNDDIDERIISELKACDFALADLTYARPSVYFEAGFAQRCVPVIFTCRKDHFRPRPDDTFGNFRVHFDLQMKNIIPWRNPSDERFARSLRKRISHVLSPIWRAKETEQSAKQEIAEFAALSTQEKTRRILKTCSLQLRRSGYKQTPDAALGWRFWESPKESLIPDSDRKFRHELERMVSPDMSWLGTKMGRSTIYSAFVYTGPALTKGVLNSLYRDVVERPLYNLTPLYSNGRPLQLIDHLFICSFQRAPVSRVMASLAQFRWDAEGNRFNWSKEETVPRARPDGELYALDPWEGRGFVLMGHTYQKTLRVFGDRILNLSGEGARVKRIPRHISINIFDSIKSEKAFNAIFSDTLKTIDSESA